MAGSEVAGLYVRQAAENPRGSWVDREDTVSIASLKRRRTNEQRDSGWKWLWKGMATVETTSKMPASRSTSTGSKKPLQIDWVIKEFITNNPEVAIEHPVLLLQKICPGISWPRKLSQKSP